MKKQWHAHLVSIAIVTLCLLGYALGAHAFTDPFHSYPARINTTLQVLSTLCILAAVILAFVLKWIQGGQYWFFWLQFKQLNLTDEQRGQRHYVFEKSYGWALILAFCIGSLLVAIADYDTVARDDLFTRVFWIGAILLVSLPSMIAASTKIHKK